MTQRTQEVRTYRENDALPAITKTITQVNIARYAEASGDHNPLHLDPAFAATTQFGGTIAHGMLVLASISEMMTAAFGEMWLMGGRLKVRFRGAARPGDIVSASGRVLVADRQRVACEVVCRNQEDVVLLSGEAEVAIR